MENKGRVPGRLGRGSPCDCGQIVQWFKENHSDCNLVDIIICLFQCDGAKAHSACTPAFENYLKHYKGHALFCLSLCRTITGAKITSLPSSVCEQLPNLQLLWVQTLKLHLCIILNTEMKLKVVWEVPYFIWAPFMSVRCIMSADFLMSCLVCWKRLWCVQCV